MIVLDTSFLVAFHNRRDVHHPAATAVMERFLGGEWGEGLLPESVFLEVVTVLQRRVDPAIATAVGDQLLAARELTFVPSSDLFLPTVDTFRGLSARGLSFADAAIVTLARRHSPGYVAGFDAGFRQLDGVTLIS